MWLRDKLVHDQEGGSGARFVEGFVTASLIFCVGPLTIQGAIEDGLMGDYTKLAMKAMMDGFAAMAFATTLGPGVIASVIVILIFQGGHDLCHVRRGRVAVHERKASRLGHIGLILGLKQGAQPVQGQGCACPPGV